MTKFSTVIKQSQLFDTSMSLAHKIPINAKHALYQDTDLRYLLAPIHKSLFVRMI